VSAHRARGFTLLETVLAAAIGSIVVSACLGIFVLIERTDRLLETRARDQAELQRLRLVMSRTFSSLLLSDAPRPVAQDADAGGDNASARARLATRRGVKFDPTAPPPAERLTLSVDSFIAQPMVLRSGDDGLSQTANPQRLEVVLFESPVPSPRELDLLADEALARAGARLQDRASRSAPTTAATDPTQDVSKGSPRLAKAKSVTPSTSSDPTSGSSSTPSDSAAAADEAEDLVEAVAMPVRAVRGVFELRPQQGLPSNLGNDRDPPTGPPVAWEMWWTPLYPRASASPEEVSTPSGEPYRVASNLRYAHWRFFDDRQRKDAMSATWTQQLPAYVELEVQTTAGLMANWMFEVDWAIGPEMAAARPSASADKTDDDSGAAVEDSGKPTKTPIQKPSKGKETKK